MFEGAPMTAHLFPLALLGAVATALTGCCERDTVAARAVNIDAPGVPAESDDVNVPVPGAIVVDFRDGTSKSAFDAWEKDWAIDLEFNSVEGEESGITVATGVDEVDAVLDRIRQNPQVEAAEPLYLYERTFVPNDPDYPKQWNLKLIDAEAAWDRSRGKGVIVAVLDTGIAWGDSGEFVRVPDLKGARFAKGYDFVHDDEGAHDDHGHGTHVAGTVAQVTHNREGVAGVAFEATLMPVKVLDHFGRGTAADISDAIRWAADHGAKVLNLSLGGPLRSEVMARAVEYARKKGATVVCAAGNSGSGRVSYPAAYPGAVAVSAVGPSGRLAPYSSWGKEIAIAAPGGDKRERQENGVLQNTVALTDFRRPVYSYFQGTSMAAPHVSGVVALLYAAGASGPDEVEKALFAGARPVEGQKGRSEQYGHGLLNAKGALAALAAAAAPARLSERALAPGVPHPAGARHRRTLLPAIVHRGWIRGRGARRVVPPHSRLAADHLRPRPARQSALLQRAPAGGALARGDQGEEPASRHRRVEPRLRRVPRVCGVGQGAR